MKSTRKKASGRSKSKTRSKPKTSSKPRAPSVRTTARPPARSPTKAEAGAPATVPPAPIAGTGAARRHMLSLSFLRDGDEFLARLETDGGQITELKNRSLDQLLTLVASELEDLLE